MPYKEFEPRDTLEEAMSKLWGAAQEFVPTTRLEEIICMIANAQPTGIHAVPDIEVADEGKVLTVENGEAVWAAGGGGGEATIANIEVTNVLPNGKTLHHFYYFTYLSEEGGQIECLAENSLAFPFVSGNPTYIQLTSGESTDGDYMRASNIAVTGDIEADGEYLTISGEGTVTITWVIV